MKEQKINIKEIIIKVETKIIKIDKQGDDIEKQLLEKQKFIDSNYVCGISEIDYYHCTEYTIKYYCGHIEFYPTSTDSATLRLNIKIDSGLIKLIQSLCLENVVEVCDKQTQLFKEIFKESVKDGQTEIQNKVNKSFLSLPFSNNNNN